MNEKTVAIIYVTWCSKITKHSGWIYPPIPNAGRRRFLTTSGVTYTCSSVPGEIFNNTIWLFEEDDDMAIDMIIQNEQEKVKIYQRKLSRYENRLAAFEERMVINSVL